jgi:hypothetical protein
MNNSKQHRSWIFEMCRRAAGAALVLAIVLVPAVVATGSAQAQTYIVLYSFKGVEDGGYPEGTVFMVDTNYHETRDGSALPKAQNALAHRAPLPAQPDPAARGRLMASYGKLPLSFEPNQGQSDGRVKFLSRGSGYTLYLTAKEAVLVLQKTQSRGDNPNAKIRNASLATEHLPRTSAVLRMRLEGANPAPKVKELEQLPGKSNYFIGNDPTKWRTDVPNYARVQYEGIYPGVDLEYYGHQRQLEYDFVVAPGANPKSIRLAFEGGGQIQVGAEGDLVLSGEGGEVRFQKPVAYQLTGHQ